MKIEKLEPRLLENGFWRHEFHYEGGFLCYYDTAANDLCYFKTFRQERHPIGLKMALKRISDYEKAKNLPLKRMVLIEKIRRIYD